MSLVSIITPAYNAEKYIQLTIESVLAQTYTNWELLIVDDGSKDGTIDIVKKYCSLDNRIKLFTHPNNSNKGVSASRNLAIDNSKGFLIALLDSDDLWLPYKLEIQIKQFDTKNNVHFVYSQALCINENGHFLNDSNNYQFPTKLFSGTAGVNNNLKQNTILMLQSKLYMPCLTAIFTRELLDSLRFNENLKYQIEDHFLFTQFVTKSAIFSYDAPLALYRVHPTSYSSTTKWKDSELEFLEKIKPIMSQEFNTIIDDEIKKCKEGNSNNRISFTKKVISKIFR